MWKGTQNEFLMSQMNILSLGIATSNRATTDKDVAVAKEYAGRRRRRFLMHKWFLYFFRVFDLFACFVYRYKVNTLFWMRIHSVI